MFWGESFPEPFLVVSLSWNIAFFALSFYISWRPKLAVRAGYIAETQGVFGQNADAMTIPGNSLQIVFLCVEQYKTCP